MFSIMKYKLTRIMLLCKYLPHSHYNKSRTKNSNIFHDLIILSNKIVTQYRILYAQIIFVYHTLV